MPDADDFDVEYFRNLLKGNRPQEEHAPPAAAKKSARPAAKPAAAGKKGKPTAARKKSGDR